MKKEIIGAACALAAAVAAIAAFPAHAAGEWDRSEDGEHWMYYDSWGEPVTDEWIEADGKTYYLDSKGYMKTGWVTDKESGNKYYLGEDGAMCYNIFAPNGDYVGYDGAQVAAYDKYRKEVKSEAAKAAKKTGKTKKKSGSAQNKSGAVGSSGGAAGSAGTAGAAGAQTQSYFALTDLNRDGYRDLVVMEGPVEAAGGFFGSAGSGYPATGGHLLEVAIWDPEEEEFQLAAEFDVPDTEQHSTLYIDPEGDGVWLEIADQNGDLRLFQLEYDTAVFKNVWSFTMDLDDWDGARYRVNGIEEDKDVWEQNIAQARARRGSTPVTGYLPVTDEDLAAQVDRLLTEEEWKRMW